MEGALCCLACPCRPQTVPFYAGLCLPWGNLCPFEPHPCLPLGWGLQAPTPGGVSGALGGPSSILQPVPASRVVAKGPGGSEVCAMAGEADAPGAPAGDGPREGFLKMHLVPETAGREQAWESSACLQVSFMLFSPGRTRPHGRVQGPPGCLALSRPALQGGRFKRSLPQFYCVSCVLTTPCPLCRRAGLDFREGPAFLGTKNLLKGLSRSTKVKCFSRLKMVLKIRQNTYSSKLRGK